MNFVPVDAMLPELTAHSLSMLAGVARLSLESIQQHHVGHIMVLAPLYWRGLTIIKTRVPRDGQSAE